MHGCIAGLEVIPDLEVPFPSDDAPEPDVVPSSPQPPGFSGRKSPECELLCFCSSCLQLRATVQLDLLLAWLQPMLVALAEQVSDCMSVPFSIGTHSVHHCLPGLVSVLPDCSIICVSCWASTAGF